MKVRLTALAVAVTILFAGTVFGTGKQVALAKAQRLTVLFQQSNIPDDLIVKEYAEAWAKEKGVDLNFQIIDENELRSKTIAAIESKFGPDLIVFPDYSAYLYQDSLSPLDDLVNGLGEKYGGWFPVCEQAFCYDGHWKAVPYKTFVKPLVYRKDIVKGVNEAVPDTWEDVARVSKKITDKYPGMYGFGVAIGPRSDGPNSIRSLLWSYGASIVDKDGNVALDSKEAAEAFAFLKDWYNSGGMAPGVPGWDDSDNNRAFMAEKIAMTINASSIYDAAKKDFPDTLGKVTGHAACPKGPAGRFGNASSQGLGIPLYSENKELAIDFLRYMYTSERLKRITMETSGGATMMLNDVVKDLPIWDDPDLRALLDISKVSYLIGYPGKITRAASAVRSEFVLVNVAARMLIEDLSPEETVQLATKEVKEIYARYK